ncbi:GapA-binding peptide SR1P [Filobacillus milosensis]|uniref:GapA-binding peptide SR1P n=1 Tax=Filobacillus milosensis TaxID=94137 RepID=A0A4Y8IDL8_9BACI|nr:GapA-binding peptide SR1P [Filobacillus milosensis]TFB14036.1 GapA-binding peptide SR1P [Filobacillus milosensis]
MGTIICQKCQKVIDYFEHIKVTKVYSNQCECCHKEKNNSNA